MEYYSPVAKSEIMKFAHKWVELEKFIFIGGMADMKIQI